MNPKSNKHTATDASPKISRAVITFPQSCFYGQSVEVIEVSSKEKVECLVRLPDGTRKNIPIQWLDYAVPSKIDSPSNPICLLSINTIREILEIVECLNNNSD